jgi:hypothetical protein
VRRTGELSGQLRRDVGGEPDGVCWSMGNRTTDRRSEEVVFALVKAEPPRLPRKTGCATPGHRHARPHAPLCSGSLVRSRRRNDRNGTRGVASAAATAYGRRGGPAHGRRGGPTTT